MLRAAIASVAVVEIKPDVRTALPGSVEPAAALPPVTESSSSPPPPVAASSSAMPGGIEVELPSAVRLRFGSDVDGLCAAAHPGCAGHAMMLLPATRVYLACGFTDIRRGFDGLAAQVQTVLALDPYLCGGRDYVAEAAWRQPGQVTREFSAR